MKLKFEIEIEVAGKVGKSTPSRFSKALLRALEHTMESDVEGAEILNDDRVTAYTITEVK